MLYKRRLNDWNCTKGKKRKISKRVGVWLNAIGSIFKFSHEPWLHDHVTGHVVRLWYKYPVRSHFGEIFFTVN